MPKYVLDTSVLSDVVAPGSTDNLIRWLSRNIGDCYISSVTLHELRYGVARLAARRSVDDRLRADKLGQANARLLFNFSERVIPTDAIIMVRAAELRARAEAAFGEIGIADSIIAASA